MVYNQGRVTPYFQTMRSTCLSWCLWTHARDFRRSVSKGTNLFLSLITKTNINYAALVLPIYITSMCATSLIHFPEMLLLEDMGFFLNYAILCSVYSSGRAPAYPLLIFSMYSPCSWYSPLHLFSDYHCCHNELSPISLPSTGIPSQVSISFLPFSICRLRQHLIMMNVFLRSLNFYLPPQLDHGSYPRFSLDLYNHIMRTHFRILLFLLGINLPIS